MEVENINLQFFTSARNGNLSEMKEMLFIGADVNFTKDGRSALHVAAVEGSRKIVQFLIENGANIDLKSLMKYDYERSALVLATECKNVEIVKLLLEHSPIKLTKKE